jgi:hypothetical protein
MVEREMVESSEMVERERNGTEREKWYREKEMVQREK